MDGIEAVAAVPGTETTPSTPETPETPESPTPETPATETETPGGEETPSEGGDEEEPLPGEPEEESIETDGRALDENTRKMVAELKKTNPAAAKALADQFYRRLAYQKEFPTVQAARQAKATIEALGGEEGIEKLQNEVSDYRGEIEQFANGDPALVEQLYQANPDSTVKMVEAAFDIFTKSGNVDAIDRVLLKPIAKRLADVGLGANLVKAAKFLEEGKGQEAYDVLGNIGKWLAKLNGDAEKVGTERERVDPREREFQEREQRLQQQEAENRDRAIGEEVTRLNNVPLKKILDPFFKDAGIKTPDGRREFTQRLQEKVWAAMKQDKVFQRQAHAIKAKGDRSRTAQFINAKFAELLPGIFRSYRNSLYPSLARAAASANGKPAPAAGTNGKPPAKPAAAAAPANGQAIRVNEAPDFDDVDWTKTPDTLWMKGYAYLKNGKYVYYH